MTVLDSTVTLNNGVRMPQIALGTWQVSTANVVHPVGFALENGYHHIDGAVAYRNAKGIGAALKTSKLERKDYFITTKIPAEAKTYTETMLRFYQELKELGTDYVDLLLIHAPAPWAIFSHDEPNSTRPTFYKENLEVWRAMTELYENGLVRAIGVSNFAVHDLENLLAHAEVKPAVNQILYHIGYRQQHIVDFCKENDIQVESYSSLGTGSLLSNPEIQKIADKYNKTVAQICYRYPVQRDIVILPKSVHDEYILENTALDFEISEADMATLDAIVLD